MGMMDELSLEEICTTFYTDEEILEAEKILTGTVKAAKTQDVPSKSHLQDIIKIFKETNPNDVPTYVARNLSRLPAVIEHLDVTRLLKEISSLKTKVELISNKLESSERIAEDLRQEVSLLRSEMMSASRDVCRGNMTDSENARNAEREEQVNDQDVIVSDTVTPQCKDVSYVSEKSANKPAEITQLLRSGDDERISNADTSQTKNITTLPKQSSKYPAQMAQLLKIIKDAKVSNADTSQTKTITTLTELSSTHPAQMTQPNSAKNERVSEAKNITTPTESGKNPARLQLPKKRYAKKISRYRPFHRPSPALTIETETQLQKMLTPQTSNVNVTSFLPVDVKKSQTQSNLKKSSTVSASEDSRAIPNVLLYVSCLDLETTAMVLANRQKARHPQTSLRLKTRRLNRDVATTVSLPLLQARMFDYHRQSYFYTSPVGANRHWERNSFRISSGHS